MKAIITGITGMDGSHLADLLLKFGYKVVGVKRRTSQNNLENIKEILKNSNFELVEGDITDYSSMVKLLIDHKDAAHFYNLAAQSHVGSSFKIPGVTWDITAKGCMNILQAIVDLNMQETIRFYQASSSEMFGSAFTALINGDYSLDAKDFDCMTKEGKYILDEPVSKYQNENTKFLPQSPYAIAKCAAHMTVRLYRNAYNMHASCGILFNHESERRGELFVTRKITKWMAEFARFMVINNLTYEDILSTEGDFITFTNPRSLNNKNGYSPSYPQMQHDPLSFSKLRLGDVDTFRDWGYSPDYCYAMYLMLKQDVPDDYVICTGKTYSVRDFLSYAFKCVNKIIELEEDSSITYEDIFVQDPAFMRPAEVPFLKGCCQKAKINLNWEPSVDFNGLVERMVEEDVKRLGIARIQEVEIGNKEER
jgi:GDPmannose 4,6-dehydratase